MRSRYINVTINLDQVRASAEHIRQTTGVRLIAVIKADAYGSGAVRVADALASVADDLAYFSIYEAREVGRPGLVLGPPDGEPAHYGELSLRPTITNPADAEKFRGVRVAISMDTGMQRFGCPPERVDDLLARCEVEEAFTHTAVPAGVLRLREVLGGRVPMLHAACTSLLGCPDAWLDAVRPGLALYCGAVRVTARLDSVRDTTGPVGYSGFVCPRVGIIRAGYCNHVREGPVLINGRRQQLLEAGMNSSFVSVDRADRVGDEVVLLGDGLTEAELAHYFGTREHEILCRYTSLGQRRYVCDGVVAAGTCALAAAPLRRQP